MDPYGPWAHMGPWARAHGPWARAQGPTKNLGGWSGGVGWGQVTQVERHREFRPFPSALP